jgi:hypothetical protein
MDELAKALAEAVRAGSSLAPSALMGYYAVRIIDSASIPIALIGLAVVICRTVRFCVLREAEVEEKRLVLAKDKR